MYVSCILVSDSGHGDRIVSFFLSDTDTVAVHRFYKIEAFLPGKMSERRYGLNYFLNVSTFLDS